MRRYHIQIDGRAFEVDVDDVDTQRYAVSVGSQRFDVSLQSQEELASVPRISPAVPSSSRSAPPPVAAPVLLAGADALTAPMPGVILRLAVAVGAQVKRGQDIAVLEAMKMENIIRAPRDGLIAEVCVAAGQQVGHGAPIIRYAKAPA